jgi:uncharacterized protein (TIGR02246 family)
MNKYGLIFALLAAGAAAAIAGLREQPAKDNPTPAPVAVPIAATQPPAKATGAEAGIKAITAEYQKAFNAADAKAAAALWTAEGEYVPIEGDIIVGRAEIEKSLAEFFKANPKATAEVEVKSVKVIGRGTASAEGVVRLKLPGNDPVVESRYTALHVLEDGKWLAASVKEWVPDPATSVTVKDIEWLIGEWTAKGEAGELKITYAWDENKVFLNGKYTITKDGKTVSSGTQVIGTNPLGGLRSWMFDSSGTTCDSVWVRDDKRWVSDALGLLPDGTEIISTNVIVPLGPDAFTWQTTEREADGVPLPALPPVKITRVKK